MLHHCIFPSSPVLQPPSAVDRGAWWRLPPRREPAPLGSRKARRRRSRRSEQAPDGGETCEVSGTPSSTQWPQFYRPEKNGRYLQFSFQKWPCFLGWLVVTGGYWWLLVVNGGWGWWNGGYTLVNSPTTMDNGWTWPYWVGKLTTSRRPCSIAMWNYQRASIMAMY